MKTVRLLTATDLHQTRWMYDALESAVQEHRPHVLALVGDFLHGYEAAMERRYSPEECASRLAALPCEVIFVRGNHEMNNWESFVKRWLDAGRIPRAPHGEAVTFGPLVVVGFPCTFGHEDYFLMGRENNTFKIKEWLPKICEQYGPAARTLWLMHEPPAGTKLCEAEGLMAGVDEWRDAIHEYQPWLTVSGHDHETPVFDGAWRDRIGKTICFNFGQPARLTHVTKTLHYGLFEFDFAGSEPSLPNSVTITAYPWQEKLAIPDGGEVGK
jgi:Icc-related predicted phosphoesterase